MKKIKRELKEPIFELTNQLGQQVRFYNHFFEGDKYPIIAEIEGVTYATDYNNLFHFYEGSEENPVLVKNKIIYHFQIEHTRET